MRLELIKGTSTLEGTCYFEFCPESKRKKVCWNEDALYLEEEVFNFLYQSFLKASKDFDYYDFCMLESKDLESLTYRLVEFEAQLSSFSREEDFEVFLKKRARYVEPDEGCSMEWHEQVRRVGIISTEIRHIAQECLAMSDSLWILGM